jgi:hypothetical protein
VLTITAFTYLIHLAQTPSAESDFISKHEALIETALDLKEKGLLNWYGKSLFDVQDSVLIVRSSEGTIYSRYSNSEYRKWFGPSDYGYVQSGDLEIFYSMIPLFAGESASNLMIFLSILVMLTLLMLLYSPHFAMTVTDPINIMVKGFRESSYNLEVLVPPDLKEDDIYQLAKLYNEEYLPMKARNSSSENGSSLELKLEDFEDFLK